MISANPNEKLHASAPVGLRCADCSMDGEACPACYSVWWQRRHPNTVQVGCGEGVIERSECSATPEALRDLVTRWRANADMLAEGNKHEQADPAVGMQRACADQLDAVVRAGTARA